MSKLGFFAKNLIFWYNLPQMANRENLSCYGCQKVNPAHRETCMGCGKDLYRFPKALTRQDKQPPPINMSVFDPDHPDYPAAMVQKQRPPLLPHTT